MMRSTARPHTNVNHVKEPGTIDAALDRRS
jgi:hypothetical protein